MGNNNRLIIVTDGSQAKIFHQENRSTPFKLYHDLAQDLPTTAEHDTGVPGRAFESGNLSRHAYEPKTDWHTHQKEIFVKNLVELFIKEHKTSKFCSAYVICPPKLIQYLRSDLHDYIKKLPTPDKILLKEITKDLTHLNTTELEKYIAEQ